MPNLQDLDDRQRAILQLLVKQGRSYDEIAELLKSDRSAVQARAQAAASALGPDSPDVGADRRSEICDYLLGQQSASRRAATREYLEDSAGGRAWARAVAGALRPLAGDSLPDIPAEPAEVDEAFEALDRRAARREEVQRSSQLGTKILFGAIGLALAIVAILALGIFDSDDGDDPRTATVTRTSPEETPVAIAEGVMRPVEGSDAGGASAEMGIIQLPSTNRFKLLIAAKGMQPAAQGSAYGVWLYTSRSDNVFVGFPKNEVNAEGELNVVADLSPDTRTYREVLITSERVETPKQPGSIVLRGALKLATQQSQTAPPATQTAPSATQTQPG